MFDLFSGLKKLQEKKYKSTAFKNYKDLNETAGRHSGANKPLEVKPISEEERVEIQEKLTKQRKKDRLKYAFLSGVIILVVALAIIFTLNWLDAAKRDKAAAAAEIEKQRIEEEQKEYQSKYASYMALGDEHFAKNEFNNSIYQYKEALKAFPKDSSAFIGLTRSYVYRCWLEGVNCMEAGDHVYMLRQYININTSAVQKNLSDTLYKAQNNLLTQP